VRPEHATLGAEGDLAGRLENIVYFGTDTHYHVRLADGADFVVRSQNLRDSAEAFREGQDVAIALKSDAVQVLRD
ncbi:MAG TPA: TOBE domain-containing protein, partial [Thermohalobaculum sp.]|nr:TOBE domain-containing protein [Thermohalobaculum sp.]